MPIYNPPSQTANAIADALDLQRVSALSAGFLFRAGLIPLHDADRKFWYSETIDNTEFKEVWSGGVDYNYLTADTPMAVASTSTTDTAGSTGARTINIVGMNSSYEIIEETATLTGRTPVDLSNQYFRVHRMKIVTAGSGCSNEGEIWIGPASTGAWEAGGEPTNDTEKYAHMRACDGQTLTAVYTVPKDKNIFVVGTKFSNSADKELEIGLFVRSNGISDPAFALKWQQVAYRDTYSEVFPVSLGPYPEGSDIAMRAKRNGVGTATVSADFSFYVTPVST